MTRWNAERFSGFEQAAIEGKHEFSSAIFSDCKVQRVGRAQTGFKTHDEFSGEYEILDFRRPDLHGFVNSRH